MPDVAAAAAHIKRAVAPVVFPMTPNGSRTLSDSDPPIHPSSPGAMLILWREEEPIDSNRAVQDEESPDERHPEIADHST